MDLYAILWKIAYEVCLMIGISLALANGCTFLKTIAQNENERRQTKLKTIFWNILMVMIFSVGIIVEFIRWCDAMNAIKGV